MSTAHKGKYRIKNPEKYVDQKGLGDITYRSSWEKQVMLWLDNNPDVIAWGSEVNVIPYISKVDGKQHRYYVDFYIKLKSGKKYLVEIKPKVQTQAPTVEGKTKKRLLEETMTYATNISKWEAARAYAESRGAEFLVWTEIELAAMGLKTVTTSKAFRAITYKGKRPAKISPMSSPKYKKTIGKFDAKK
jgi:hypothetical protein